MSRALPAGVVVTNPMRIPPWVKDFPPVQTPPATGWFGNVSCVAASFSQPARFCCCTQPRFKSSSHQCEGGGKFLLFFFTYVWRFLRVSVYVSSVSLKSPATNTDKRQSRLHIPDIKWCPLNFCLPHRYWMPRIRPGWLTASSDFWISLLLTEIF